LKLLVRPVGLAMALFLLPVCLALNLLAFILLVLSGIFGTLFKKKPESIEASASLGASVVIPSWNGKHLLAACLPALQKALKYSGNKHEVIVVDNGSSDGTADYIVENFPWVTILKSPTNLGFGRAANEGVKAAARDIVVLLNNDMIVEEDFLNPLLKEFEGKPDLFAVTSQIFFWDKGKRREETGKTAARMRHGNIYPFHELHFDQAQVVPVTYAGGGSSAYDRKKLLELGGFDDLYSPFYVEDLDLSFMAWKRGWRILFNPSSVVYHKHQGTIGSRFTTKYVQAVLRRNEILFAWKNIDSVKQLAGHFGWSCIRLVSRTAVGSFEFNSSYFSALRRLFSAMGKRFKEGRESSVSSDEVFLRSRSLSAYRQAFAPNKLIARDRPLRILFACPYIPYPPTHGGAVRMYNLIRQLAREHEVYLLSFVENEQEFAGMDHLQELCRDVKLILRQQTWRRDNVLWFKPQSSLNEFYSREFERALEQMVDNYDIDIVQYEYTQMADYVRNFPRAKEVLTEHDVTFLTRYRYFRQTRLSLEKLRACIRWLGMYVYELEACRRFDLVFTVSTKEKELLEQYDRRLKVSDSAPTGADTGFYRPEARTAVEKDTILFVGFFKHFPNVEGILYFCREIYPQIKREVPGVKLYVVGANPPPEVRELAEDSSIVITGFVEDLRDYYAKASLFVVPILRGAGTRVKIFEAMAAGIPIVSTTLGAEGINVTPEKDILLADTPEQFARQVVALLNQPSFQFDIAAEAHRLVVEKYEWANIAKQLAGEYYAIWETNTALRGDYLDLDSHEEGAVRRVFWTCMKYLLTPLALLLLLPRAFLKTVRYHFLALLASK